MGADPNNEKHRCRNDAEEQKRNQKSEVPEVGYPLRRSNLGPLPRLKKRSLFACWLGLRELRIIRRGPLGTRERHSGRISVGGVVRREIIWFAWIALGEVAPQRGVFFSRRIVLDDNGLCPERFFDPDGSCRPGSTGSRVLSIWPLSPAAAAGGGLLCF